MEGADRDGDDRTFRVNFMGDGAAMLRERVNEKLKEFMGDYTDDTLVEYVIVLIKNGRSKEEARKELNVFLGSDSDSFVSWLWDHLGSNLHLYVQPQESHLDEAAKVKPTTGNETGSHRLDSDAERGKSNKSSRSRHNKEWRGLVRDANEPPPFQSSVIDNVHTDERIHHKVSHAKRSPSPQAVAQKKRRWPDERQQAKRGLTSQVAIDAPRRLLQFAVRDAVTTKRPSTSTSEPALKRLRSVVSTSGGDSIVEGHRRRIRLGRGTDFSQGNDQQEEFGEAAFEGMEYGDCNQSWKETHSPYLQRSGHGDATILEPDARMASDSASDNEGYDGISAGNEQDDSLTVQYNMAENSSKMSQKPRKDQDQPALVASNSQKIVNISVNVNTWKPSHYQEPREMREVDVQKSIQESESGHGKSGMWLTKENSNLVTASNGNAKSVADAEKDSQKTLSTTHGLYSTGRPIEDADSRTVFVNNVHFAATKDSLSRHFNKFGEVLKVIIVTDAATGHPKGSAYVEFMRKEAAENALSLDGTSFMSRILKVVKKSSAHQEPTSIQTWPRVLRGSPFVPPRFAGVSFPRGVHGLYRARLPIRAGARSFQWKRDAQGTANESGGAGGAASSSNIASPGARSLTYVRPEPRPHGSSAAT
ncbi:uncharacterized protein LOC127786697 isoform X2 [Diospyros lotus]|uniref:uncharacterized protein LOC127786697 isoform X2 n=1 Tax=Diospyros lotus TaxID=55363 RepID=UPI00225074F0|nr:uncharacterized protein LOC127786697 isoform X2 [Diospyros lotus]